MCRSVLEDLATGVNDAADSVVNATKDLTGAAATEEATADARTRLEEEKATALQDREDARAQNAADQLSLSRQSPGGRTSTSGGRTSTSGGRTSTSGGRTFKPSELAIEQDFLGL